MTEKKYDDGHKNENMTISFSKLNNKWMKKQIKSRMGLGYWNNKEL